MFERRINLDKQRQDVKGHPETGIQQEWNEDLETGIPYWGVYYKGVKFAELDDLKAAHDRLQKLMALDTIGGE
jgi:hypothetical protein